MALRRLVQYYENGDKNKLRSFKVNDKRDAQHSLWRLNQKAGWYVEKDKFTGTVHINQKIYAEKPYRLQ